MYNYSYMYKQFLVLSNMYMFVQLNDLLLYFSISCILALVLLVFCMQ